MLFLIKLLIVSSLRIKKIVKPAKGIATMNKIVIKKNLFGFLKNVKIAIREDVTIAKIKPVLAVRRDADSIIKKNITLFKFCLKFNSSCPRSTNIKTDIKNINETVDPPILKE